MRLTCPLCGERDLREFTYLGHETYLSRPVPGAPPEDWDAYLHLRENAAGPIRDLWQHSAGCAAWLLVERDTVTHAVATVRLASAGAAR